jgi:methylated-DNA-[protein]-cysteine S-methyltransferase
MNSFTSYYLSPAGWLRLQSDGEYITAIGFVDGKEEMIPDDHFLLQDGVQQLQEYFEGRRRKFDLPIKQQGSPFQQKVWQLLMDIPFGKTVSYNELSKIYGDPKSIRAIASANGRNAIAIIVPCHRVIGSDQSLTGYAGGLPRKKFLLEHEAVVEGRMMKMF